MTRVNKISHAMTLVLVAAALTTSSARAQTPINIGDVGSGSLNRWPAAIATAKGFFRAAGVEPRYISTPSSASVMQQLAAGSLDMGSGGLVDPIRAIDKGAPITLFRTEDVTAPSELYGKNAIKTIGELRGKTIMIGGVKDITRIHLERLLAKGGIKIAEVDLLYAGATAPRYAALASNSIDATILSPPFNFKAKNAGMSLLGSVPDVIRDFPYTGYAVSKAWSANNRPAILGFLTAYQQGVDWFMDPAHRGEAVDLALAFIKVDRSEIESAYDFYRSLEIFDRKGAIAGSGLDVLLRELKTIGDLEGSADAARFYDASLVTP